jgi:hypothetical protein
MHMDHDTRKTNKTPWLLLGVVALATSLIGDSVPHGRTAWGQHTTTDSVRDAHSRMEQWLGRGQRREAWQRYLKSRLLEQQIPKRSEADIEVVKQILDTYDSGEVSLQHLRFVEMRIALESWLRELEAVPRERLPDVVRHAKGTFQMPTEEELAGKREMVRKRADELEAYLARGGPAYLRAWKQFLHWEILTTQLAADRGDLQQLNVVLQQFFANQVGLERAIFTNLRRSLHDYMNATLVHITPNMAQQFDEQLETLAQDLEAFGEHREAERALSIARSLGWLNSAGQANHVLHTVRQHYAQPNFYATVSTPFAAMGVNDRVNETQPVQDQILGTSLRGTARTQGDLRLQVVPHPERAEFEIQLDAVAQSNNVGVNRGVTIYSTGTTRIDARKRILFDEEGLRALDAQAACDTKSRITGIGHHSALVRKIAWKRAHRQKGQAEEVASRRAEKRVERQMDERAANMLAQPQQNFLEKFRHPLLRRGEFPQVFDVTTSPEGIILRLLQAQMHHLGAPSAPPAMDDDYDFSLRVHESFVGNFSEAVLGGYTLTDERLVQFLEDNEREVPDELRIDANKDPWSITFSTTQPVRVEFRDQAIKIEIRGRRFTRGEQRVNEEMKISAVYAYERTDTGIRFVRQGDVQADYVRQGFENAPKIAIKTLMRTKFGALFKPEFTGEGLQLPGNWGKSGSLDLGQLDSNSGWIIAGWNLGSQTPSAVVMSEAPDFRH